MEIADLYDKLKLAYTGENLHLISARIINMFREHQYDALRAVQKVVNEYTPSQEKKKASRTGTTKVFFFLKIMK